MARQVASYVDELRRALWHSRQCGEAIQRACVALGVDPDEPEESGLIEPPPDDDLDFPDHVDPTAPLDPDLVNPQSKSFTQ
jgi:hypothetical protein